VRRIKLGGTDVGLALKMSSDALELEVDNPGPALTLTFRPELASGTRVRAVEVSDGSRPRAGASSDGEYEVEVLCAPGRTLRVSLRLTRPARGK
jgi:hypothetical protein